MRFFDFNTLMALWIAASWGVTTGPWAFRSARCTTRASRRSALGQGLSAVGAIAPQALHTSSRPQTRPWASQVTPQPQSSQRMQLGWYGGVTARSCQGGPAGSILISVLCDAFTLAAGVFIDFTLLVLGFTPLALAAGARRIVFIWSGVGRGRSAGRSS